MVFFMTCAVAAALLLVPGFLLLRSVGFSRAWALMLSPLLTISVITVLGEVFARIGIFSNASSVLATFLVVDMVLIIGLRGRRGGLWCDKQLRLPDIEWKTLALYVLVGSLLGYYLFYRCMPSGGALFQNWDLGHHINVTRAMIDSGRFSSFGTSAYMTARDIGISPLGVGGGFYPSGTYFIYALVHEVTGFDLAMCINATNITFCAFVYPLGTVAALSMLFPNDRRALCIGAFSSLFLVGCPWNLLTFGPLYPNLGAMACVPAFLVIFAFLISARIKSVSARLCQLLLFLLAVFGLLSLHPNSLFSAAILLVPYVFHRLWVCSGIRIGASRSISGRILAVFFSMLCLVLWFAAYRALSVLTPGVINMNWPSFAGVWQEIVNIFTQSYLGGFDANSVANFVPAILAVVGIARVVRDDDHSWIVASYVLACIICFVGATTDDTFKHFVAGFWYTDPVRLATTASMAAVPLVTVGATRAISVVLEGIEKKQGTPEKGFFAREAVSVFVLAALVFMPPVPFPGFPVLPTAFGGYRQSVHDRYSSSSPLSDSERDFLSRASKITGDDLVINNPWDGSHIAYGLTGMRTYYRGFTGFGDSGESAESKLIREHLDEYASRADVRDAVKKLNAKYVLVLDKPSERGTYIMWTNLDPNLFKGIRRTGSWSPAFTEILTSDDGTSHLYKISQ